MVVGVGGRKKEYFQIVLNFYLIFYKGRKGRRDVSGTIINLTVILYVHKFLYKFESHVCSYDAI